MKILVYPNVAYCGDVFSATIKYEGDLSFISSINCITAKIYGVVCQRDSKMNFLESIPVILPITSDNTNVVFQCVIPIDTLPTIKSFTWKTEYYCKLEIFYLNKKSSIETDFTVESTGVENYKRAMTKLIIVHEDMIRVDLLNSNHNDTAFGYIVEYFREKINNDFETLEDGVKVKEKLMKELNFSKLTEDVLNDYKDRNKGDIYYYTDFEKALVENDVKISKINMDCGNLAVIERNKYFIDKDLLVITYKKNVLITTVYIYIYESSNGEEDTREEILVSEFVSDKCEFHKIVVNFDNDKLFSLKSSFFNVEFEYVIIMDDFEFNLPITKLGKNGRYEIE